VHPSESEVVYDGFRSDTRQDPKVTHMPFLPFTLPGMCMLFGVLPHEDRRTLAQMYNHLPALASFPSFTV
jgi:hypothetical protein